MKNFIMGLFLTYSFNSQEIKGNWILINEKSPVTYIYPIIEFRDNNYAVLYSSGDTIYTATYEVKKNKILLEIGQIQQEIKILKCNSDTLVLTGFAYRKDTFVYVKNTW